MSIYDVASAAKAQGHLSLDPIRAAQRAVRGRDTAVRRRVARVRGECIRGGEVHRVARPRFVQDHDVAAVDADEAALRVQREGGRVVAARL